MRVWRTEQQHHFTANELFSLLLNCINNIGILGDILDNLLHPSVAAFMPASEAFKQH
jgi:hypothetical protein